MRISSNLICLDKDKLECFRVDSVGSSIAPPMHPMSVQQLGSGALAQVTDSLLGCASIRWLEDCPNSPRNEYHTAPALLVPLLAFNLQSGKQKLKSPRGCITFEVVSNPVACQLGPMKDEVRRTASLLFQGTHNPGEENLLKPCLPHITLSISHSLLPNFPLILEDLGREVPTSH